MALWSTKKTKKPKKKTPKKRALKREKNSTFSMDKPLQTYKSLQKEIDKVWQKLRKDVKRRDRDAILKGRNDLLLLLGECNYMARECTRCLQKSR